MHVLDGFNVTRIYKTRLKKMFIKDKHASLFSRNVGGEDESL